MSSRRPCTPKRPATCQGQRGVTLVELLAALVIGLLVIGAAIAAMLLSRNSAAMVTDVARLQQQGSYALRVIGMQARQAGALSLEAPAKQGLVAFDASFTGFNEEGFAVFGLDGEKGGPDTVSFSSQSAAVLKTPASTKGAADANAGAVVDLAPRDCLANTAKAPRLDSTFFVERRPQEKTASLKCRGLTDSQPIVANVADFQVWYRVKESPTTIRRMSADEVKAVKFWGAVSSVEICLDLMGAETTRDQPSKNYLNCNGQQVPHNGVLHMLFRNVFDLRTQGAS